MTIAAVKEKLHEYVDSADDIRAVEMLRLIEEELEKHYDYRSDDEFWDEMEQRVDSLKSGKVKGVSWEDIQRKAKEITG